MNTEMCVGLEGQIGDVCVRVYFTFYTTQSMQNVK